MSPVSPSFVPPSIMDILNNLAARTRSLLAPIMSLKDVIMPNDSADSRIKLPGFGLPYNHFHMHYRHDQKLTLTTMIHALGQWAHKLITVRERCMLFFINKISDKPDWTRKVYEETTVANWKREAMTMDWDKAGIEFGDMSEPMFDYCIKELREKAVFSDNHQGVVRILDTCSGVFKSDSAIPSALRDELRKAIEPLENIPEHLKDWHPGSGGKVLDIVHPSLFPLVYQRSRILPDSTISIHDCLQKIGQGVTLPNPKYDKVPFKPNSINSHLVDNRLELWSARFQWLPCDVSFPDGENARIDSYINNLHPKYEDLYHVIEKMITKAIPLWNLVCQCHHKGRFRPKKRIPWTDVDFRYAEGTNTDISVTTMDDNTFHSWLQQQRVFEKPEPGEYHSLNIVDSEMKNKFAFMGEHTKIQVIVKLANIHLTPEKPKYDGGTWHIEGQLNEHIVATALYYYDNHNITDSSLSFRTSIQDTAGMDIDHEQGDDFGIKRIFGVDNYEPAHQELGSVLTRDGRLIAFPNGFQHRVGSFKLQDPTQPGHRKILALFLVAPDDPVISTANIPPQQRDWWAEEIAAQPDSLLNSLPKEILDMIGDEMDVPIGLKDAKIIREELMAERSRMDVEVGKHLTDGDFNFCEH